MATGRNHLIDLLPLRDRQHLLGAGKLVPLVVADVLCEPGERSSHVYFPIEGFISLVARIDGHPGLEVGMVGQEGMLGAELALGVPTAPWRGVVQGPGTALCLSRAALLRELAGGGALQGRLNRYFYVLLTQLAASAACVRFHLIGPRLARWLLMSQDRTQTERLHVTHEILAAMLGVRRVGITMAAGALQRAGLISYHRGELTVVDRPGLESVACQCYAADCRSYADVMR